MGDPASPLELPIRSLCNLDGLERILGAVVTRSNAQQAALQTLRNQVDQHSSRRQLEALGGELRAELARLEQTVIRQTVACELVPQASVDERCAKSAKVGELASWLYKKIESVQHEVQNKANRSDVDKLERAVEESLKQLRHNVSEERASTKEVAKLRETQHDVVLKLKAIQDLISTKLDKIELSRVEQLAQHLENYSDTNSMTKLSLEEALARINQLETEKQETDQRVQHLEKAVGLLESKSFQMAPKQDLEQLAALVVRLDQQHESFAPREELHLMQDKIRNTSSRVAFLSGAIATLDRELRGGLASIINERDSTGKLINAKASVEQVAASIRQLREKLDALEKANAATKREGERALQKAMQPLGQKVDLALRFVDWFSERGLAFEHNYNIMEKQLGALSKSSFQATREPFRKRVSGAPPHS
mmetsp:Transcript_12461/g.23127  ORF Transcript_12461/g.23127 Transcript_12461/m.23127 type:complete len:424 (-) Transcript_12461:36-1307(-)